MTQTYLIPQYLYDYVYPFSHEIPFKHRKAYKENFPEQGKIWLKQTGCSLKYILQAVRHGFKSLPATCIICGKPLTEKQISGCSTKQRYQFCSSKCARKDPLSTQKRINTYIKKYNVDNPAKSDVLQQKRHNTLEKHFGSIAKWRSHNHQIIRNKRLNMFLKGIGEKNIELVTPIDQYIKDAGTDAKYTYHCLTCGCVWDTHETNYRQLFCPHCVQANKSTCENAIKTIIDELLPNEPVIFNTRKVIKPLELDIFLPNQKLAFEYNGSYYHRVEKLGIDYHQQKTLKCLEKGIRLIHIFDWEYILHYDQVVNAIKNALGMHKHQVKRPIIQAIDQHAFNNFVLDYSTDSAAAANTYYGIFESDVLIAVLGFVDQQCVKIVNNSDYNISYETIFEQLQWPIIQTNLNEIDINVFTKMGYKPVEYSLNKPYYANAYIDKTLQKPKQQTSCISDAGQVILVQH